MKINALDLYTLNHQQLISLDRSFVRLYGRLLGSDAYFLYEHLRHSVLNTQNFEALSQETGYPLAALVSGLEAILRCDLVDIHMHQEEHTHLIIDFKAPLNAQTFMNHDVLGRAYLKAVGPQHFEEMRSLYLGSSPHKEGYVKIEKDQNFKIAQDWSEKDEKIFSSNKIIKHELKQLSFDTQAFLNQCSSLMLPYDKRSEKSILGIAEIGSVYGISVSEMMVLVGKAYAKNDDQLDLDLLRKYAAKLPTQDGMVLSDPYEYPPVIFLKRLRNGLEPSALEKYLLVKLVSKDGLKPSVLNVLLEHHFHYYQSKINTKILEEMGLQMASQNISSKDEALVFVGQFNKRKKRQEVKSTIPEMQALSESEQAALKQALKSLK